MNKIKSIADIKDIPLDKDVINISIEKARAFPYEKKNIISKRCRID